MVGRITNDYLSAVLYGW